MSTYLTVSVPDHDLNGANKATVTIVFDTSVTPAKVIATYSNVSYPYFGQHGGLPSQFIDEYGNLRNNYGKVVFAGDDAGTSDRVARETIKRPYLLSKLDMYHHTFKARQELKRDMEDMLTVVEPPEAPAVYIRP